MLRQATPTFYPLEFLLKPMGRICYISNQMLLSALYPMVYASREPSERTSVAHHYCTIRNLQALGLHPVMLDCSPILFSFYEAPASSLSSTNASGDQEHDEQPAREMLSCRIFFFFYQKPFITSMPHRQSWFHGTYDKLTNTLSYCYAISTYNSQTTVTNGIHILTLHQSQASSSLRFRRRPIPSDSNAMTGGGPYT